MTNQESGDDKSVATKEKSSISVSFSRKVFGIIVIIFWVIVGVGGLALLVTGGK